MSVKLMGAVFDLELDRDEFPVMLALADSADDNGGNCYPGVGLLAWKTNLSERTVQRVLRKLEASGLIELAEYERGGRGLTPGYVIHVEKGVKKSPYRGAKGDSASPNRRGAKGDSASPILEKRVTSVQQKGDTVTEKGDIHDSDYKRSLDPSVDPSVDPLGMQTTPSSALPAVEKNGKRNPIFDAVVECWLPGESSRQLTRSASSMIGKVSAELVAVGATPERVREAWAAWPRLFPGNGARAPVKLTPTAFAKHYPSLVALIEKPSGATGSYDSRRFIRVEDADGTVYHRERC